MIPENYKSEKQKIEHEIERLQQEAEELQKRHRGPALESIVATMREYDITPDEVRAAFGGRKGQRRAGGRAPLPPKYRDPASGRTWSGRGRTPGWLVEAEQAGRRRDEFLIK